MVRSTSLLLASGLSSALAFDIRTNMPQFLSKDIQFSIDDLIESSRLISADGLGVSSADVSFGTLDDQWVLEAMADDEHLWGGNITERSLNERQIGNDNACAIPNCLDPNDPGRGKLQSGQVGVDIARFVCGAVDWVGLPAGVTFVSIKTTGAFCGAAGLNTCTFGVGFAIGSPVAKGLGFLRQTTCDAIINEQLDYCKTVSSSLSCQHEYGDGSQAGFTATTAVRTDGRGAGCQDSLYGGFSSCQTVPYNG